MANDVESVPLHLRINGGPALGDVSRKWRVKTKHIRRVAEKVIQLRAAKSRPASHRQVYTSRTTCEDGNEPGLPLSLRKAAEAAASEGNSYPGTGRLAGEDITDC